MLKKRALGAAFVYEKKVNVTKDGTRKEVSVKKKFMAATNCAKNSFPDCGGSTACTVLERIVIIAAFYVLSLHYLHLKMNSEISITAPGNVEKSSRTHHVYVRMWKGISRICYFKKCVICEKKDAIA